MDNNNKKAIKRLISAVWTLEYRELSDNSIEIIHYSNKDEEGYEKAYQFPTFELLEDDNRTVLAANINKKHFDVINQKHIFSYGA